MDKLYFIVGASGSGKDYAVNKICEIGGYKKVISRTTRKRRKGESSNNHQFVSNQQADKEFDKALFKTFYNENRYYVLEEDLENADFYIIDPKGVKEAPADLFRKYNVKIVYIKVPWYKRAYNMMFRRKDGIKNVISRLINDRKEFKDFENIADYVFTNNEEFYEWFHKKQIKNFLK